MIIFAAFIAILVTTIGIILSNNRTKDALALTRTELEMSLRPWISIKNPEARSALFDKGNVLYTDWEKNMSAYGTPNAIRVIVTVENIGKVPATSVSGKVFQQKEPFDQNTLYDKGADIGSAHLIPGESFLPSFEIPFNIWKNLNKDHFYFGMEVKYNVLQTTKSLIGRIWHLHQFQFSISDSWIDDTVLQ